MPRVRTPSDCSGTYLWAAFVLGAYATVGSAAVVGRARVATAVAVFAVCGLDNAVAAHVPRVVKAL